MVVCRKLQWYTMYFLCERISADIIKVVSSRYNNGAILYCNPVQDRIYPHTQISYSCIFPPHQQIDSGVSNMHNVCNETGTTQSFVARSNNRNDTKFGWETNGNIGKRIQQEGVGM